MEQIAAEAQIMKHLPIWSGLVYGNPGLHKTFFAATFPKPLKVFMFDPPAKGLAYHLQGNPGEIVDMSDGGKFQFITNEKGEIVVEIEYFNDSNPRAIGVSQNPCAYERFQTSLVSHMDEGWTIQGSKKMYQSVVLDSFTFCERACLGMIEFKINPAPGGMQDSKHNAMQWAGQASSILMTDIIGVWPWIPCHSLVLAHVNDKRFDEQAKQLYGVSAIGTKLPVAMPGAFAEVYLMYKEFNEKKKQYEYWLMTESDGAYMAQTHIGAPNPCEPTWKALWKG